MPNEFMRNLVSEIRKQAAEIKSLREQVDALNAILSSTKHDAFNAFIEGLNKHRGKADD